MAPSIHRKQAPTPGIARVGLTLALAVGLAVGAPAMATGEGTGSSTLANFGRSEDRDTEAVLLSIRQSALRQGASASFQLGMKALGAGDLERAYGFVGEAIQLQPRRPDYLRMGARLAFGLKRYEAAEALHRRFIQLEPQGESPEAVAAIWQIDELGSILLAQGRLDEADEIFTRVLELRQAQLGPTHPDLAGSFRNLAALALARGDAVTAERHYLRALGCLGHAASPATADGFDATVELAELYRTLGRIDEAEQRYEEAILLAQETDRGTSVQLVVAMRGLASLFLKQGRLVEAEQQFAELYRQLSGFVRADHALLLETRDTLLRLREHLERSALTERTFRALAKALDQAGALRTTN